MGKASNRKTPAQTRSVRAESYTMKLLVMSNNAIQSRRIEMVSLFGLAALGYEAKARLEKYGRVDLKQVMDELSWLTTGIANGSISMDPMPPGEAPAGPPMLGVETTPGEAPTGRRPLLRLVDTSQGAPYNEPEEVIADEQEQTQDSGGGAILDGIPSGGPHESAPVASTDKAVD